ncbi:hypothetical protein ISF_04364 [Cordyceps fumosorosea ARSEF 2679]|uniref:Uncharacterized protein n=1 Tax=Cordyceps fumosorosea (strain ARSEF 2679) TaxID=1081104 RepID=A0A167XGG1_CORFA|nr:hypothetical protein ISF_04364 [Cordyceps fumosorosea ARSEF 2679]OAA64954.1 hypothetical protein ISF_04364 [Cordyceps fumosorosea ARSEF 2679]
MYFTQALAILALTVLGAEACQNGKFACGHQGAPGEHGSLYVCNNGKWNLHSKCAGGGGCCMTEE